MFEPVRQARINVSEFSKLVGVSRVAASMWLNGRAEPHRLHAGKISRVLKAIASAIETGELPLPPIVARADRVEAIANILASHIRKNKGS